LLARYSAGSLDDFVAPAFRLLPRMVPCDYVSAFCQRAGDGFLKERDSRGRTWKGAFMRRYVELIPAVPVLANPGVKLLPTGLTTTASEAELHGTAFYREVRRPNDWARRYMP
jgi:hypothetical protein